MVDGVDRQQVPAEIWVLRSAPEDCRYRRDLNLFNWGPSIQAHTVGLGISFREDLSQGFHDYGMLWTPSELIFEVDGDPVGVIVTHDGIGDPADVRFSTALGDWAGKGSGNPVGHDMVVQSVRVFAYDEGSS